MLGFTSIPWIKMDDGTNQLLPKIQDLQWEHLELIGDNVKEAEEVNRIALKNHTRNGQQSRHTTKLMVVGSWSSSSD